MILSELLYKVSINQIVGSTDLQIKQIQFDSRKIQQKDLFVAISGTQQNGHDYIQKAIENGAIAVICEELPNQIQEKVTYIKTNSSAEALGILAANFYKNPSKELCLIGITGTNGKTTCTSLLHQLFQNLGKASVLISTIKILIQDQEIPTQHTTPDILIINKILRQAVDQGCQFALMEVSSHGIHQRRIAGLDFDLAGFTNITHDHLDYHKTFANYIQAKKKFFDDLKPSAQSITNLDDKNGMVMLQNTRSQKHTYALKTLADFKGKIMEHQFDGMLLNCNDKEFWSPLIGEFNAYNLLLVYGVAKLCGLEELEILTQLSKIGNVSGRFQVYHAPNQVVVIVDYAHTPDALKNVLTTIQNIRTKQETLYTIVGCGGDRDRDKRPKMAKIAVENSDQVIFTSDNPRNEDPNEILLQMQKGVPNNLERKTLTIPDRKEAIKTAFLLAKPKDIVVIAGKGHENYQEIKGTKYPFSDLETAIEISRNLEK